MTQYGTCFACGKLLKGPGIAVQTVDSFGRDEDQRPWVGPECARKVKRALPGIYRPSKGGPGLRWIEGTKA